MVAGEGEEGCVIRQPKRPRHILRHEFVAGQLRADSCLNLFSSVQVHHAPYRISAAINYSPLY